MAKISQLPLLANPTGDERVPVVDAAGITRRVGVRSLVEAAAKPSVDRAEAAAVSAASSVARVTAQDYGPEMASLQGYIRKSDGQYFDSAAWRSTDFLPISEKVAIEVNSRTAAGGGHIWADKDKKFISGFGDESNHPSTIVASPPAGAAFARFTTINGTPLKVRAVDPSYSIPLLKAVADVHILPETKALIAEAKAAATAAQAQMAVLADQIDEMTDDKAPFIIDLWPYTKSIVTPATQAEAAVVSRDSDTQLTVAAGMGVNFAVRAGMVVEDSATNKITSHAISAINGDQITVVEPLPASPTRCQTMHDAINGQHLCRLPQLGLADYVVGQIKRYCYRKKLIWGFHGPDCVSIPASSPDIYLSATSARLVEVTRVGGAGYGGWVAGTSNLARGCGQINNNENITTISVSQYLSRGYLLQDVGAGKGFQFRVPLNQANGFFQLAIGGRNVAYTDTNNAGQITGGRYRLEVIADTGAVLHDQVYPSGKVFYPKINFSGIAGAIQRVTLVDAGPMSVALYSSYAFAKSAATSMATLLAGGSPAAFLMDSWSQYPIALNGEVRPLRADGSTADGMCFFTERLRTRHGVVTQNMGKGSTTSAWGRHNVKSIIALNPKPLVCFVNFAINDTNSVLAFTNNPAADSPYDFDPNNMWAFKTKSTGGIEGRVSYDIWLENMIAICIDLIRAGIKPIILMPPHTASSSQAQNMRDFMLARIARGLALGI